MQDFLHFSVIHLLIPSCGEAMMPASDNVLLVCPRCGASMHLFESFPAQSWLPEVHVFECDLCKEMILRDRSPESAASLARTPVRQRNEPASPGTLTPPTPSFGVSWSKSGRAERLMISAGPSRHSATIRVRPWRRRVGVLVRRWSV